MKRRKRLTFTALLLAVLLVASLCGCAPEDQTGLTKDEPDITVDYLAGEYAKQLVRDGAEHVFGTFTMEQDENGTITLNIAAKEFVVDDSQTNGFYIADRNMDVSYPLAEEARTTFLSGDTSLAKIMNAEDFILAVQKDFEEYGNDNPDYNQYKLYDIYVMNGQAELVLAKYIP